MLSALKNISENKSLQIKKTHISIQPLEIWLPALGIETTGHIATGNRASLGKAWTVPSGQGMAVHHPERAGSRCAFGSFFLKEIQGDATLVTYLCERLSWVRASDTSAEETWGTSKAQTFWRERHWFNFSEDYLVRLKARGVSYFLFLDQESNVNEGTDQPVRPHVWEQSDQGDQSESWQLTGHSTTHDVFIGQFFSRPSWKERGRCVCIDLEAWLGVAVEGGWEEEKKSSGEERKKKQDA